VTDYIDISSQIEEWSKWTHDIIDGHIKKANEYADNGCKALAEESILISEELLKIYRKFGEIGGDKDFGKNYKIVIIKAEDM
jgi:hypothetical protein